MAWNDEVELEERVERLEASVERLCREMIPLLDELSVRSRGQGAMLHAFSEDLGRYWQDVLRLIELHTHQ